METLNAKWTGVLPLIMQKPTLVDPFDPASKLFKTKKDIKKKSYEDLAAMDEIQWKSSLYWDETDGLVIPTANIERAIRDGATKTKQGKIAEAGVLVDGDHVKIAGIRYPKDLDELYRDVRFKFRHVVRTPPKTGARVMKVRPIVPVGWVLEFSIIYDSTTINKDDVVSWMKTAGQIIGIGDWRPKYGRFTVEVVR